MNKQITGDLSPSSLTDDIGLCYYDPTTETLKEFDPSVSITVGPFEYSVRRFYIVKPNDTIKGSNYTQIKLKVESGASVIQNKIKIGRENLLSIPSDFAEYGVNNEVIALFGHHTTGIIPVDILTHCESPMGITTSMSVTLEVS